MRQALELRPVRSLIETALRQVGERASIPFAVRFAEGGEHRTSDQPPAFTLVFRDARAYWRIAAFGHIGLLEAYFDGELDIEGNLAKAMAAGMEGGMDRPKPLVRVRNWWHELRFSNASWRQARTNADFHYALGPEFYRLWLDDPLMMYTCAYWKEGTRTLEEAQRNKIDYLLARRKQQLPRHVVDLVPLRFLERACAFLPVRAGVHHQRVVEPQAVELGAERVVEIGVGPRLAPRGVGEAQLVPPVADPHQRLGAVHAAFHPRRHGLGEIALDVELAVEIRFEQADVPEGGDAPVRARVAEHQRERRRLVGSPVLAALGEADRERDAGALADLAQRGFDEGSHGPQF